MESSGFMRRLPPAENFFRRLSEKGYEPRNGQRNLWNIINENPKDVYVGVLPTGYGKSDTAIGAFLILMEQARVNRMLIVVPTDTQRQQYIRDLTDSVERLGGNLPTFMEERPPRSKQARKNSRPDKKIVARDVRHLPSDITLSNRNACFIFVTTVQSVLANTAWYQELITKNTWLTFFDEYHKLNADEQRARWGAAAKSIWGQVILGLTATPRRSDATATIFEPYKPDVNLSYRDGYEEGAVRGVKAHIEHYFVDMRTPDGEIVRVRTEDLKNVVDFSDYQTKRNLRFTDEYLSGMLTAAYDCLLEKNERQFEQHQMLVFAINNDHARHVSDLLNTVYDAGFSDWVGHQRTDDENEEVMDKFDKNELPCLVQVDKATEGFNNKRASVLVFLNILRKCTVKAIQAAGRGVRRNHAIREFRDDKCDMFASPDTEVAELIVEFAEQSEDLGKGGKQGTGEPGEPGEPRGPRWPSFPPFDSNVIGAEFERSELFQISPDERDFAQEAFRKEVIIDLGKGKTEEEKADILATLNTLMTDEWIDEKLKKRKKTDLRAFMKARQDTYSNEMVNSAASRLAGSVVDHMLGLDLPVKVYKKAKGKAIHAINLQWMKLGNDGHDGLLTDEFQAKYEWIGGLSDHFRDGGEIPEWLAV